ncbi:MAG: undecaprenyldiphospho-muramoylpentapeptide beta-N-acetylglucosaminyltransferase [Acidobacteria bacterium]|nr:undecaprenyldiphospho-muramoylpentapeptide beta-N-acetylglucosaminyltransferase [Acidobacteriota bacterium]
MSAAGSDKLRVVIAGGGTGGHVIPALSIARELRDRHGASVHFIGTERGLETKLVPEAGFPISYVRVGMLKNVSLLTRAKTLGDLPRGVLHCMRLLREIDPQVVIGVGGYASGPAMIAAILKRIPTMVFEPNAVPGMVNRAVGKWVNAAAVSFSSALPYFRHARVTGRPVRPEFFAISPKLEGSPRLLVMGGSQGARALNEVVPQIASWLLANVPGLTIVHQAGARHEAATREAYERARVDARRYEVHAFLNDIPAACAGADLILCRSGGTVEELCAAGRASVLVPFPQAADDHQRKNAESMVAGGASIMILEKNMTPGALRETLRDLLMEPARLEAMGEAARKMAHPRAVEEIGEMAIEAASQVKSNKSASQQVS